MAVALLNPYCSLGELCHELKRSVPADGDEKDELHEAINNASRMVDQYKGRDYFQHDYSTVPLLLDQFGGWFVGDAVFPPYAPIISLTAVSLAGAAWVSNVDFFADLTGNRILRLNGSGWGDVRRPGSLLSLTGKFGYAQATTADIPSGMPGNIKLAARTKPVHGRYITSLYFIQIEHVACILCGPGGLNGLGELEGAPHVGQRRGNCMSQGRAGDT